MANLDGGSKQRGRSGNGEKRSNGRRKQRREVIALYIENVKGLLGKKRSRFRGPIP